jgi:16S rRNA (guanine527-N7)-methyltransferase
MLEELLKSGLAALGLPAAEDALPLFRKYYDLLTARNRVMNLTAIAGEDETARLHFLDSAAALLPEPLAGRRVIDVGSGAGFPGLPMKLLEPSLSLTLLDAQRKRVDFLREVCEALGLADTACIHARAESGAALRETFDCAVSRAVARLNVLAELCLPYVKPGGVFLALKGPAAVDELSEAQKAVCLLGGTVERLFGYDLPGGSERRSIVVIRKTAPTPKKYPRRFALIKSSPL